MCAVTEEYENVDEECTASVDQELEDYLNDEEVTSGDAAHHDELVSKVEQLDALDASSCCLVDHDLVALRQLAVDKHGLINKRLRRKVWPILLLSNKHPPSPSSAAAADDKFSRISI